MPRMTEGGIKERSVMRWHRLLRGAVKCPSWVVFVGQARETSPRLMQRRSGWVRRHHQMRPRGRSHPSCAGSRLICVQTGCKMLLLFCTGPRSICRCENSIARQRRGKPAGCQDLVEVLKATPYACDLIKLPFTGVVGNCRG